MTAQKDYAACARQIVERQQFIESALPFIALAVGRCGKILREEDRGDHIVREATLKDFHGFSFFHNSGLSMFGGDIVTAWYHPGRPFALISGDQPLVLDIEWWNIKECKVKYWSAGNCWQNVMREMLVNGGTVVIEQFEKKERARLTIAQQNAFRDAQERESHRKIDEEMRRLGF